MHADCLQSLKQPWRPLIQLPRMIPRQTAQNPIAPLRYSQDRVPLVIWICRTSQKALPLRPVDEFNRAIVLQAESLGGIRNGYGSRFRCTRHLQEKLVLLRLQSGFQGCGFAEMQESSHFKAKLSQCSNERVWACNRRFRSHRYIVSRYTYLRNLSQSSIKDHSQLVFDHGTVCERRTTQIGNLD